MTSENEPNDTNQSRSVGASALFTVMNDEYRADVVRKSLDARSSASSGAVQSLSHHIDTNIKGVSGYRHSSEAYTVLIEDRVDRTAKSNDDLAAALLRIWIEIGVDLKDVVGTRLIQEGVIAEIPGDRIETIYVGSQKWGIQRVIDDIHGAHPEFSEDDIVLMTYCLARWMLEPDREATDLPDSNESQTEPVEAEQDEPFVLKSETFAPILQYWRRSLSELPADAPEFDYIDKEFVDQILAIADNVREQKENVAELGERIDRLSSDFGDLLTYFGWAESGTLSERKEHWMRPLEALRLLVELQELLEAYSRAPTTGTTFAEQEQYDRNRRETGNSILSTIGRVDGLEINLHEDSDAIPDAAIEEDPSSSPSFDAPQESPQIDAQEDSRSQLLALRRRYKRLDDDYKKLSSGYARLEKQNDRLREDLGDLKDKPNESGKDAINREGQVPREDETHTDSIIPRPDFPSVQDVVDRAKDALSEQLDFHPNTASTKALKKLNASFARPNEVAKNLEWLANTYFRNKKGDISVPDLAKSLYDSTTWKYAPFQSDGTMGKYPSGYKTKVKGREIQLTEHIGRGARRADATIRIAFAWDEEREKVVVGYIGRHQDTDAS